MAALIVAVVDAPDVARSLRQAGHTVVGGGGAVLKDAGKIRRHLAADGHVDVLVAGLDALQFPGIAQWVSGLKIPTVVVSTGMDAVISEVETAAAKAAQTPPSPAMPRQALPPPFAPPSSDVGVTSLAGFRARTASVREVSTPDA